MQLLVGHLRANYVSLRSIPFKPQCSLETSNHVSNTAMFLFVACPRIQGQLDFSERQDAVVVASSPSFGAYDLRHSCVSALCPRSSMSFPCKSPHLPTQEADAKETKTVSEYVYQNVYPACMSISQVLGRHLMSIDLETVSRSPSKSMVESKVRQLCFIFSPRKVSSSILSVA